MVRVYVLAALLLLLCGCIYIPAHASKFSVRAPIGKESLQFIKVGSTTREEVLLNLGTSDYFRDEESVFIWHWETQAKLYVLPVVYTYPVGSTVDVFREYELVIEFDDNGIVKHYEIKKIKSRSSERKW